jgi:hypothetical protein
MVKQVFTPTFTGIQSFPKPIPKVKRAKKLRRMTYKGGKKKKRAILPSLSSLKRKADSLFSKFIINRDKKCVLCNSTYNLTNGHLIKRGNMSTRYDEINCHCLCSKCNFKDWKVRSYHDVYIAWFIKSYGTPFYYNLVNKIGIKQMKRQDYLEIIKKYS